MVRGSSNLDGVSDLLMWWREAAQAAGGMSANGGFGAHVIPSSQMLVDGGYNHPCPWLQ